jgi:hypothetical protein
VHPRAGEIGDPRGLKHRFVAGCLAIPEKCQPKQPGSPNSRSEDRGKFNETLCADFVLLDPIGIARVSATKILAPSHKSKSAVPRRFRHFVLWRGNACERRDSGLGLEQAGWQLIVAAAIR